MPPLHKNSGRKAIYMVWYIYQGETLAELSLSDREMILSTPEVENGHNTSLFDL